VGSALAGGALGRARLLGGEDVDHDGQTVGRVTDVPAWVVAPGYHEPLEILDSGICKSARDAINGQAGGGSMANGRTGRLPAEIGKGLPVGGGRVEDGVEDKDGAVDWSAACSPDKLGPRQRHAAVAEALEVKPAIATVREHGFQPDERGRPARWGISGIISGILELGAHDAGGVAVVVGPVDTPGWPATRRRCS